MRRTQIHLSWRGRWSRSFRTGISMHGHTMYSREGLHFLPDFVAKIPLVKNVVRWRERAFERRNGAPVPYDRAWWTPPLMPSDAVALERSQIGAYGLEPLVSITDHDTIEGATRMQILDPDAVPVSMEWTVPFESTAFHLGVHNLPGPTATGLVAAMQRYSAAPDPAVLPELLDALDSAPEVLVVFNHPLWDERGRDGNNHARLARSFLSRHRRWIHALELNGQRPWPENRRVVALAEEYGLPIVAGGDRHGLEPNAMINVSNTGSFSEFISELREDGISDIVVMPQYRDSLRLRLFECVRDVLGDYPEYSGRSHWTDRVFCMHGGLPQPLSALWPDGGPSVVHGCVSVVRMASHRHLRPALRAAFADAREVAL